MRFRSLNAQAVGHVHGKACLPWVFELAGKYGIKVIAMEITHDSHLHEIQEALHKTGKPTGVMIQIGTRNTQNFELLKIVGRQRELPVLLKRGFNNLRYSPVSREAAGIAAFLGLLGGYALLTVFPPLFAWLPANVVALARTSCGWGALAAGPLAIHLMYLAYRIPARPFWNHWQTWTAFFGSTFALGVALVGAVYGAVLVYQGEALAPPLRALAWPLVAGIVLEGAGLVAHARDLVRRDGEGAASHYEQRTAFGKTYLARNVALAGVEGWAGLIGWGLIAAMVAATAFVGRALFYVLVIPTTMPGAFFWRNRGFEEHARKTGLAAMPQVGVVPDSH